MTDMTLNPTQPMALLPAGGGRSINTLYVAVWLLIGLAAGGYLVALAVKPELVPLRRTPKVSQPQGNNAEGSAEPQLRSLRGDLDRARAEAAREAAARKAVELRLQAAERQLATQRAPEPNPTASQGPAPQAAAAAPTSTSATAAGAAVVAAAPAAVAAPASEPVTFEIVNAKPRGALSGAPVTPPDATAAAPAAPAPPEAATAPPETNEPAIGTEVAVPLPGKRPASLRLRTSALPAKPPAAGFTTDVTREARIETGSIASRPAAAVPSFGAAEVVRAAAPGVGVRLTSGPSVDALRLSWSLLTERFGTEVSSLEPRYIAGGPGLPFTLVAGPLPDGAAASALCSSLTAKGVPCSVGNFSGNAL
ncbi:MAG: hypothetical protein AB7E80_04840 [Hyphomicrobiaceae bacterium]